MSKPKVSVVIPTFNEAKNLPKLLACLKSQDYLDFEIIISDGRSADQTVAIARENGCSIVDNPARYAEIGKLLGVGKSSGEYIAFIDGDNEPASATWLSLMMKPLIDNPRLAGSFCLYHPSRFSKFDSHYMNKYYSLLGNDPISWYIGGIRHTQTNGYRIFKFDEYSYPLDLALANGTIVRKNLISSFRWDDDMYPLMLLVKDGKEFACVYDTFLHHHHLTDFTSFCRKYTTRARFRNIYRKQITNTRLTGRKLRFVEWLMYSLLFVQPARDIGIFYKRWPERFWLIHPLACATQTLIYTITNGIGIISKG